LNIIADCRDAGAVDQHITDRQIPDAVVEACHVAAFDQDLAMLRGIRRRSSRGFGAPRNGCGSRQPLQHGTSSNSHGFLPYLIESVAQVCRHEEWAKPNSRRGFERTGNRAILQVVILRLREPAGIESAADQEGTS
jgi:hypothetical protein